MAALQVGAPAMAGWLPRSGAPENEDDAWRDNEGDCDGAFGSPRNFQAVRDAARDAHEPSWLSGSSSSIGKSGDTGGGCGQFRGEGLPSEAFPDLVVLVRDMDGGGGCGPGAWPSSDLELSRLLASPRPCSRLVFRFAGLKKLSSADGAFPTHAL